MKILEMLNELDKMPMSEVPSIVWVVLFMILFAQGSWIFFDASKRGENKWLWGFFGLLNVSNLIIYLLVTRVILKSSKCPNCNKYVRNKYKYCPHCSHKINE